MSRRLKDILTDIEVDAPHGIRLVAELLSRLHELESEAIEPTRLDSAERGVVRSTFRAIQKDLR